MNCIGIRINGLHFENKGSNVSGVDSRNLSWNVGCTIYGADLSLYTQITDDKDYSRNMKYLEGTFINTPENLISYTK
ncbi:hypothetical protein [Bacillus sp. B3-WWTP-C-10-D-3]|uniref:hypothetical protein n=1 Tax=Bacillus sp. B3-WWTP-C-10-D-3 TaxID=2653217 RepID=UPI0012620237|nr:hypothetical protein [Bacillus sp. B3-WWTP-C-10-D-3]KAB7640215.1 hypothetical protein GBN83_08885 [Bacillus sp. B3-WWTP-C-10-D-3]